MRSRLLPVLLALAACGYSQNEFDKYGPFGSMVHKDLKEALKSAEKVYKMDLSYKMLDQETFGRLAKLADLQALKLNGNEVTEFPQDFGQLRNLFYLASFNNRLRSFPPNLKGLYNLSYLELQHTAIDSIPAEIAYLNRLQSLKFGNTDDTLKLAGTMKYLARLKDVSFENCILDSLPAPLFTIPGLYFLYLSNTNTWYLPEDPQSWSQLEVLILENNPVRKLPFKIYKAQKLRILSLRNTAVTKLPDSISELQDLSLLDLRGCRIEADELEKLKILLPGCEIRF